MSDNNYQVLERILKEAYEQAAEGKGKERHAVEGEPFERQPMFEITRRLKGSPIGGVLYQAVKKIYESSRLPYPQSKKELLGAMNYLAGGVALLDETAGKERPAVPAGEI